MCTIQVLQVHSGLLWLLAATVGWRSAQWRLVGVD
eukprot:COSAG01_NODE_11504_length_1920_cov_1.294893_1_plen_34_part_10